MKSLKSIKYHDQHYINGLRNQSFKAKAKDNRTPEEIELIKLKKLAQLKMENDICPKG